MAVVSRLILHNFALLNANYGSCLYVNSLSTLSLTHFNLIPLAHPSPVLAYSIKKCKYMFGIFAIIYLWRVDFCIAGEFIYDFRWSAVKPSVFDTTLFYIFSCYVNDIILLGGDTGNFKLMFICVYGTVVVLRKKFNFQATSMDEVCDAVFIANTPIFLFFFFLFPEGWLVSTWFDLLCGVRFIANLVSGNNTIDTVLNWVMEDVMGDVIVNGTLTRKAFIAWWESLKVSDEISR